MTEAAMSPAARGAGSGAAPSRSLYMTRSHIGAQLSSQRASHHHLGGSGGLVELLGHPTMMAAAKSCVFVKDVGRSLGFPARTVCTAQLLVHRVHIFQPSPPVGSSDLATACLLVAAKMEETIKRLRDILAHSFLLGTRAPGADFDPQAVPTATTDKMRPAVLAGEQFVLDAIGFDFRTSHPHQLFVKLARLGGVPRETTAASGWTILSDSFFTTLPIQYPPVVIAAGSLCLAWNLDCGSPADTTTCILKALSAATLASPQSPTVPATTRRDNGDIQNDSSKNKNNSNNNNSARNNNSSSSSSNSINGGGPPASLNLADPEWWARLGVSTEDIQSFVRQIVDFYLLFLGSGIASPEYMELHENGLPSRDIAQRIGQWRMRLDGALSAPDSGSG
ncbi:RNA polymerase II C-terminal domain kinase beta subunit [Coemansia javaensis]|uniref:RNA polymerase II C-terminal domain kinase beta subunit n=1 Tax=Coemansia javaensis TaxID=2761396 RepID=A0A9W8HEX5_9FUNG|nr:RNA polymerase II C-terminal domain kinase beta subunit [Coemansia javaensis]